MRRIFGAVLIGLGALLLVAAGGLPLIVAPAVTQLPYDLRPCPATNPPAGCLKPSVARAKDATFLQLSATGAKINTGDLLSTTEVIPQAKITADEQSKNRLTDDSVVWDVFTTTARADDGTPISSSSTELAIDRVSGAAVTDWKGQWIGETKDTKDTSIAYKGEVYKFPFGTEKKDYPYWDSQIRSAPAAKFTSVETIEGIETYHFVQTIPETSIPVSADDLAGLLATFEPTATTGAMTYRNTREVWVDPVTGALVKVREQPHQVLTPNVGEPITLLAADFVLTPETIKDVAKTSKDNAFLLNLVKIYLPIAAGLLGLILVIVGFVLLRRRPTGQPATTETDRGVEAELPAARHSLREAEDKGAWTT